MVIYISNLLINKYKGKYTLKCEYDREKNEFNRKLNGAYEDIDVYIQCANRCKIFYYGNRGTLQFYCPSVPRGKNIIRTIYGMYINPKNTDVIKNEVDIIRGGEKVHVVHKYYKPKDEQIFNNEIISGSNMIFDVEITDEELLFKFKYKDMDKLVDILNPSTVACNRSPFSTKNLQKSDYKIPDEDLGRYKSITSNLPQNKLISLVHISNKFLATLNLSQKKQEEMRGEMKRLGMKCKEYYHYIHKWNKYLDYLEKNI